MAKLYFRYGSMGSAKTLNLLAVAHNYGQQNKKALLMKPELDIRFGKDSIKSRTGLEMTADLKLTATTCIDKASLSGVDCILVDEVQFLSTFVIDQFRDIATELDIPVICYGLRTDFRRNLFEGSKRMMEIADSIEEIKTTCAFCNKKAIYNLRMINGKASLGGRQIELGSEDMYLPACPKCYDRKIAEA